MCIFVLEGPLRFLLSAVCRGGWMCAHVYVTMSIGCSSTKKVNLHFSNENAMTNVRNTWYVGSGGHKCYPCGLSSPSGECAYLKGYSVILTTSFYDMNQMTLTKKSLFPKFQLIPFYISKLCMIMCVSVFP